jgi:hypothetical protein
MNDFPLAWKAARHYFGQEARWEKPSTMSMGYLSLICSLTGMGMAAMFDLHLLGLVAFAVWGAAVPWIYHVLSTIWRKFGKMLNFVGRVNGYATRLAGLQVDPVGIESCWIGERFGEPHRRLLGLVVFNPGYGRTHSIGDRSNPALKFVLEQRPAFRQMLEELVEQLDRAVVSKDASDKLADAVNRMPENHDDLVAAGEAARAMPDDAWGYFFKKVPLKDQDSWLGAAIALLQGRVFEAEDRFNARMLIENVKNAVQPQTLGMEASAFESGIAILLSLARLGEPEELRYERERARSEYDEAVQPPGEEADTPEKTAKHALMSLPQAD